MRQRGFTLIEVLVALAVLAVGAIGIMALLSSTVAASRSARRLERARSLAVQAMEDLRGTDVAALAPAKELPPVAEGVTYHRRYTVTPSGALVVVSVTAGWIEGAAAAGDPFADPRFRGARVHMVRTTLERL